MDDRSRQLARARIFNGKMMIKAAEVGERKEEKGRKRKGYAGGKRVDPYTPRKITFYSR